MASNMTESGAREIERGREIHRRTDRQIYAQTDRQADAQAKGAQ